MTGVPCLCRLIDDDLVDARDCPLHGPDSDAMREERERDAADEAAYWREWEKEP